METSKASVIISVYNSASTCLRTIESVLNQTYKNIEVVIVDDCSTDFTLLSENIDKLNDNRIKLIRQPENLKAPAARNRGVMESSGDVVFFLDSDDIWERNRVEKTIERVRDKVVVISKIGVIYVDNYEEKHSTFSEYDSKVSFATNLFSHNTHNLIFQTSSLALKKTDFLLTSGFNENLPRHQDFQFVFDLEDQGFIVDFIDETLVYYVKDKASIVSKKGWSISSSEMFINKYIYKFDKELLQKFLVIQLLGPSIRSRVLFQWFSLAKRLNALNIKLVIMICSNFWARLRRS